MQMSEKLPPSYFPALTGVRAMAAYMVCLFHFNPFTERIFGSRVHNFFNEFHVGVTIFFVLSGFLIAYRYFERDKIDLGKYFLSRFIRIYPVYFILTTVVTIAYAISCRCQSIETFLGVYFMNISFLRGFFSDFLFTGILQGWSLTVEEMFYLTAPFSFMLIKKRFSALIGIPLLLLLTGLGMCMAFKNVDFYGFFKDFDFMISYTFLGRSFEFFAGIGLAILYLRRKHIEPKGSTQISLTYVGGVSIILCIFLISLFSGDQLGINHPIGKLLNNLFLPVLGVAVFFWGLITEETLLSRFLSTRVMVFLGKVSYAFYLIHIQVGSFEDNIIFVTLVSIVLSIFIFKVIEEPLHNYLRRRWIQ